MKHNNKILFSKGDCEFDPARLELGIKTMFSGNKRVCIWKTSPDGETKRGQIAYYNLHTGCVVISASADNYPEIDFEKEMKMYADDPDGYESIYNENLTPNTEELIELIDEKTN